MLICNDLYKLGTKSVSDVNNLYRYEKNTFQINNFSECIELYFIDQSLFRLDLAQIKSHASERYCQIS